MSTAAEQADQQFVRDAVGTRRRLRVEDFTIGEVTGLIESADDHGYAIRGSTDADPDARGRYLLWANLTYADEPDNPRPDICDYCGRDDVEFEDGLRCKLCAEEQDTNDETEAANATA